MRKQILGTTAALLGAGALSFGLPAAPTHGAAWKPLAPIPFPAGAVSDVAVVSAGPGDAVAAAVIDGAVYGYTAVDGVWTGYDQVRGDVDASGLVLAANGTGDVAVAWEESVSGDNRLRVSRRLTSTSWTGQQLLTPAGTDVVGAADLGIADNGLVIATATVDGEELDNQLLVTEWPEGGTPGTPEVLAHANAWNPALDVNKSGEALISYTYTGLIDEVVNVVRRSPGKGWNLGDSTSNSGDTASATDVAISDNGHGQVVYAVVKNGFYVAETSLVLPDGTAEPAQVASPLDEYVSDPSVDINASGSALFSWIGKKDGLSKIRYSSAANAAYPGASAILSSASLNAVEPTPRISDSGLRVIQYADNGSVLTAYRTGSVQPFVKTNTSTGFAQDHAVDVDGEGNAVMVAFKPGAAVHGRFLDAAGPTVSLKALPANTLAAKVPVSWTMKDSLSTIPGTDVYATSARWNEGAHTDPAVVADNVVGTQADIAAVPGTTYCFQVRPFDSAGNATTSAKKCTTVPLDDRALLGDGWGRPTQTGNFRNTLTTATKKGRVLTRTGVKAKRLALVVRKTANSGTVRVSFDGDVLGTFNLKGTGKKKVVPLASFPTLRSGTLTVKVTSPDGKYVGIDGLVVAK